MHPGLMLFLSSLRVNEQTHSPIMHISVDTVNMTINGPTIAK